METEFVGEGSLAIWNDRVYENELGVFNMNAWMDGWMDRRTGR